MTEVKSLAGAGETGDEPVDLVVVVVVCGALAEVVVVFKSAFVPEDPSSPVIEVISDGCSEACEPEDGEIGSEDSCPEPEGSSLSSLLPDESDDDGDGAETGSDP